MTDYKNFHDCKVSKDDMSNDFDILVNGKNINATSVRVSAMPFNRYWPGQQRPLNQTEKASYIYISSNEFPLEFTLTPKKEFKEVIIRPLSRNILPIVEGKRIKFSIEKAGYFTLELDGYHHALHIFVDPLHNFELPENKEKLLYFDEGVHNIGFYELESDTTVYIHRNAIVYGAFIAINAKNIKILGEGVLDGSFYERKTEDFLLAYDFARAPDASWEKQQLENIIDSTENCFTDLSTYKKGSGTYIYRDKEQFDKLLKIMNPVKTGLQFYACENIEIKGIIFRNCAGLSITQAGCKNIHYENVKLIGMWRYNSDGIDFYNCQNCSVKNSFLRTFDDTICIKGQIGWDTMDSSDILIEGCVLWNDWGHTLDIGVDTVAPEIKNITFRNCDLIHNAHTAIDVGNGDRADIHDVLFENIRIELSKYDVEQWYQETDDFEFKPVKSCPAIIEIFLYCGVWSNDELYGKISDVTFKDVSVFSDSEIFPSYISLKGYDEEHSIKNVTLQNITHNKKELKTAEELNITANEFAEFHLIK